MMYRLLVPTLALLSTPLFATTNQELQKEITLLQKQTQALQAKLDSLQKQVRSPKVV